MQSRVYARVRSWTRARWALVAVVTWLNACAPVAHFTRAEPAVPTQFDGPQTTTLSDPAEAVDLAAWWDVLDDPVLSAIIEEALVANHDLRTSVARLREARARVAVAGGARYPSINAGANSGISGSTADNNARPDLRNSASIDASWEIDLFGRVRNTVDAAEFDAEATALAISNTRVSIAAEIAVNYVETRRAQRRVLVVEANIATLEELLVLTELRRSTGIGSEREVVLARAEVEQALANIHAINTTIAQRTYALDVLRGAAPGTSAAELAAPRLITIPPLSIAVAIPAEVLRRRPDVLIAERRAEAELLRVDVANAQRLPSLRISGSIGIEALTRVSVGSGAGAAYSLLAGLTAPLFQGGRLRAQVVQQDAVAEQAAIAYEAAVLGALVDVENALVALTNTHQRLAPLRAVLVDVESAAAIARARFETGVADVNGLLDAERSNLSAAENLANAEADVVIAMVQLYRALGGGWPHDADVIENNTESQ